MELFEFKIFEKYRDQLICAVSTRHGGVSPEPFYSLNMGFDIGDAEENVEENYRRFCTRAGVDLKKIVVGKQSHSDNIVVVDEHYTEFGLANFCEDTDGFVTDQVGTPIFVRFADCQGIFLYDPVKRVVAAVHSGWRGNVKNIAGKAVRKMKEIYGCDGADIEVGVSPSLGPNSAYFKDPEAELPEFMWQYVQEGHLVNLWACTFDQLKTEGIREENMEFAEVCTFEDEENFFSYRRAGGQNGHTGRMTGAIQLT